MLDSTAIAENITPVEESASFEKSPEKVKDFVITNETIESPKPSDGNNDNSSETVASCDKCDEREDARDESDTDEKSTKNESVKPRKADGGTETRCADDIRDDVNNEAERDDETLREDAADDINAEKILANNEDFGTRTLKKSKSKDKKHKKPKMPNKYLKNLLKKMQRRGEKSTAARIEDDPSRVEDKLSKEIEDGTEIDPVMEAVSSIESPEEKETTDVAEVDKDEVDNSDETETAAKMSPEEIAADLKADEEKAELMKGKDLAVETQTEEKVKNESEKDKSDEKDNSDEIDVIFKATSSGEEDVALASPKPGFAHMFSVCQGGQTKEGQVNCACQ